MILLGYFKTVYGYRWRVIDEYDSLGGLVTWASPGEDREKCWRKWTFERSPNTFNRCIFVTTNPDVINYPEEVKKIKAIEKKDY